MAVACLPLLLLTACFHRDPCDRDAECEPGLVCYPDHQCLPRDVAARAGAPSGDQCVNDDKACRAPGYCWNGYCVGEPKIDLAPMFDGISGVDPDGSGALLVYWALPTDDLTPQSQLDVLLWRSTSPGTPTTGPPLATIRYDVLYRDTGLKTGTTYYYRAMARDATGHMDNNVIEVSATVANPPIVPPGVDYATQIQPIFSTNCVGCHGGSSNLYLNSLAGVQAGGARGPIVVACDPDHSNLPGKLSPNPPFGARMPRSGPPYLPPADIALIRQWIADGAQMTYDPNACDHTPPVFTGILGLAPSSTMSCRASWSAASDDHTAQGQLRYRAYIGLASRAESFAAPAAESAPGALSLEITGLGTGVPVWVVVRAADTSGNQDSNISELQCTP